MNSLVNLVLAQVLVEGPQIEAPSARDRYITETINEMTNMELLERISNALAESK